MQQECVSIVWRLRFVEVKKTFLYTAVSPPLDTAEHCTCSERLLLTGNHHIYGVQEVICKSKHAQEGKHTADRYAGCTVKHQRTDTGGLSSQCHTCLQSGPVSHTNTLTMFIRLYTDYYTGSLTVACQHSSCHNTMCGSYSTSNKMWLT